MVYLSSGNIRMDIPTFSLPAEISCPRATLLCSKWCYAKKSERYPITKLSRIRNLNDSKREDFVPKMIKLIKNSKSKYIRIHESGDFYSQIYLDKWIEICKKFPNKIFLAYTQNYNLDYSKKPKNLIIYWSVWPDNRSELPLKGLYAYVIDNGKNILPDYSYNKKAKICTKGHGIKCNDCLYCFKGKGDVVFKLH